MNKRICAFFLALLMAVSLCACAEKPEPTQPLIPVTEAPEVTEPDLADVMLPITLKDSARLFVGEESFDLKSAVELKAGHTMDELEYNVVSDDTVASVDANGILTRKGYGQVSVSISLKSNPATFTVFNATFAPANLYGTTYKGGFKKADGTLGNEISLVLNTDKTFTLTVGAGKAKFLDVDYDLAAASVGEFTGTFEIDATSLTPVELTSAAYSDEPIKGAFGKTVDGAFCIRVKLNTVITEGTLRTVVIDLIAE